jgi:hypothetical protein
MIRTSEQTDELMVALARAQAKFGAAIKNSVNPAFRSKYADISSIIDATLEHLNAEGIVLMQHPSLEYKGEIAFVTMTTRIQFKGQWLESDLSAPAMMRDRFDAQSVGSACTYLSRYQMQNILVVPREDDDGQKAVGSGSSEAAQEVGKAKIAAIKAAKSPANASSAIPTLFFSRLANGSAELVNVKEFGSTLNEVAAEGLRLTLKKYVMNVKGDLIVPAERFEGLEQELTDCKVPFREVAGA